MSAPKLRKVSWWFGENDNNESDDSERYRDENELYDLDKTIEELFKDYDFNSVANLRDRVKKDKLYQDILKTKSLKLEGTYLQIAKNQILLRRALRRVDRHYRTLDDHVSYRLARYLSKQPGTKPDDEPASAEGADGAKTDDKEDGEVDADDC